jgi:hypothetical protein
MNSNSLTNSKEIHTDEEVNPKISESSLACLSAMALPLILGLSAPIGALAGEADARALVKSMSDFMASQKAISFAYDANLEVVTANHQKLALASSGMVTLNRPDKLRATQW